MSELQKIAEEAICNSICEFAENRNLKKCMNCSRCDDFLRGYEKGTWEIEEIKRSRIRDAKAIQLICSKSIKVKKENEILKKHVQELEEEKKGLNKEIESWKEFAIKCRENC